MYDTRNDLPASVRTPIVTLLNNRLADAIDLGTQAKQAHWNVKGPNFIALHELFDQIAEHIEDHVDTLAERITALGGTANGTIAAVSRTTQPGSVPDGYHRRHPARRRPFQRSRQLWSEGAQGHRRSRASRRCRHRGSVYGYITGN